MARTSIPYTGSRVSVHCFISDVISDGRVQVEDGTVHGWAAVRLEDGHNLTFTLSGDRSSLRMVVAGILRDLTPDDDSEPPAAA
jgi:hypothetical protein